MFPYIEVFGVKWYMTGIGIILAGITFLITVYQLSKKYNQDFVKFFTRLPVLLISTYILWLYSTFVLQNQTLIPTSFGVFSPYGYRFGLLGLLIAIFGSILYFLSSFRRSESKKIWIDIFFFGLINAMVVLWVFLVLGDTFVGKECQSWMCVQALVAESDLIKYTSGVYPIGIFLSMWALLINVLITFWKMTSQKNWLGIWGFILFLGVLLLILPFWNYPAHGIINMGIVRFDLYHIVILVLICWLFVLQRRWRKPY